MVKITLRSMNPRETDIVSENMTVREFLEAHDVNYSYATTSLDGTVLNTVGLDATFADHGVTDTATVSCIPFKDNGAKAIVVGSSCVVQSDLTPEQIKQVKRMHPEALVMYDENDEMIFRLDIDETIPGNINQNGACFGNATSSDGKATITVVIDPTEEHPEEIVYNKLGAALLRLKDMEAQLKDLLPDIENEENEIKSMIIKM